MIQSDARVAAVRRFNRLYTRRIGVLDEGHLHSPYSLTEGRVLYELAQRDGSTAGEVIRELGIDAGYLSRILRSFEERALIERRPSTKDRRQSLFSLTAAGRRAFEELDTGAAKEIATLLRTLPEQEQRDLLDAMQTIERLINRSGRPPSAVVLRDLRPGDLGWVVERHGALYAAEYGWDRRLEGLIAGIVAQFVRRHDPTCERAWIAERDGINLGTVFVVKHPERTGVAQLRLLLVEPSARGAGLGRRLVQECTRFARESGYHTIMLWTNSVLVSARKIYEAEGYRLVKEEVHNSFGPELVAQTWEKGLATSE